MAALPCLPWLWVAVKHLTRREGGQTRELQSHGQSVKEGIGGHGTGTGATGSQPLQKKDMVMVFAPRSQRVPSGVGWE